VAAYCRIQNQSSGGIGGGIGGSISGGISGGQITVMSAATGPPGSWDNRCEHRREVAGEGDLMLSGGVVYGDAGLQPSTHTSLV
jgi:hypothetical protein